MTIVEIGMMVAFIVALLLSGWKLYAFMPNKPLEDDDTTAASIEALKTIMYDVIKDGELQEEQILEKMRAHPGFNQEHFWRFNHNRLKQLLNGHFLDNPHHDTIEHIYHDLNKDDHKLLK